MEKLESLTFFCPLIQRHVALVKYTPKDPNSVLFENFKCPQAYESVGGEVYCFLKNRGECTPFYKLMEKVAKMKPSF